VKEAIQELHLYLVRKELVDLKTYYFYDLYDEKNHLHHCYGKKLSLNFFLHLNLQNLNLMYVVFGEN
jgi:hypothetical protein